MSSRIACFALLTRDVRSVIRSRSQLASTMLTPIFMLLFLGNGVSEGLQPAKLSAGNFTAYLIAGAVVMTSVFSSTFASASYYRDRDSGILRMFLSAPHPARVILLGKSLAGVAIGTLQGCVVLCVAAPFVGLDWQYGVIPGLAIAAGVVVLMNVLLAGASQALASRIQTMQGFHMVFMLGLFPLLFFSGAFFPLGNLPVWLELLGRFNPLSYAVDALELAVYADGGAGYFGLLQDFAVLGTLSVAVYVLGFAKMPRLTWSGR